MALALRVLGVTFEQPQFERILWLPVGVATFVTKHGDVALWLATTVADGINTLGSVYYTEGRYDKGSLCYQVGCGIAVCVNIFDWWYDMRKNNFDIYRRKAWIGALAWIAPGMFATGVIFYYTSVANEAGEDGYNAGAVLFIVGSWLFMVGVSLNSIDLAKELEQAVSPTAVAMIHLSNQVGLLAVVCFISGSILFLPIATLVSDVPLGSWCFVVGCAISCAWSLLTMAAVKLERSERMARLRATLVDVGTATCDSVVHSVDITAHSSYAAIVEVRQKLQIESATPEEVYDAAMTIERCLRGQFGRRRARLKRQLAVTYDPYIKELSRRNATKQRLSRSPSVF